MKNNPLHGISCLSRCEILALSNAAALALASDLNDEDLDMLGNIISTIGSILSTFSAICCENEEKEDEKPLENS